MQKTPETSVLPKRPVCVQLCLSAHLSDCLSVNVCLHATCCVRAPSSGHSIKCWHILRTSISISMKRSKGVSVSALMHAIHYPKSLNIAVFLWTQRDETDDIRGNGDAGLFGSKLVL